MSSKLNKKWHDLVDKVQNANNNEVERIKWEEKKRKKAYKNQLDDQVAQHQVFLKKRQEDKKRERTQMQNQVQQEKNRIYATRMTKMKTQQKYGAENYRLANNSKSQEKRYETYRENPFAELVFKEEERKQKTKKSFQLQNRLNQIQQKIHRESLSRRKESQRRVRQQFQKHVQDSFKKKEDNDRIHKLKFHSLKKGEKNDFDEDPQKSFEQNYINFLNYQSKDTEKRRKTEKQCLDDVLSKINQKMEVPDSSPAYLGRQSCSFERKKQLNYIDRQLQKLRAKSRDQRSSNFIKSQMYSTEKAEKLPIIQKKNRMKIQKTSSIEIPSKIPISLTSERKPQNLQKKTAKSALQGIEEVKREKRTYQNYNFITGTYRTIQI